MRLVDIFCPLPRVFLLDLNDFTVQNGRRDRIMGRAYKLQNKHKMIRTFVIQEIRKTRPLQISLEYLA